MCFFYWRIPNSPWLSILVVTDLDDLGSYRKYPPVISRGLIILYKVVRPSYVCWFIVGVTYYANDGAPLVTTWMKMGVCIHCRCEKVMISQAIFRLQTLRATPPGFVANPEIGVAIGNSIRCWLGSLIRSHIKIVGSRCQCHYQQMLSKS